MIGRVFNRLTVISKSQERSKSRSTLWNCQCSCGNVCQGSTSALNAGTKQSCGCIKREFKERRERNKYLSSILGNMRDRCYNNKCEAYKNYGGRGITVCDEWMNSRTAFYEWSHANGYKRGLSIDRVNNDGPYAPWNCKWVTRKEQSRNKRTNHIVQISEKIKLPLVDAVMQFSVVPYPTVVSRITTGWPVLEAVLLPHIRKTIYAYDYHKRPSNKRLKSRTKDAATDATLTTL